MTKPYTPDDFSRLIFADRTWRIREISDLKTAVKRADSVLEKVLLRAIVTVSYAHWEGHVKKSAKLYLTHIALRKIKYSSLSPQFLRNYLLPRLTAASSASLLQKCSIIDDFLSSSDKSFSRVNEEMVNTKSNLNFDVLKEICTICEISSTDFDDYENFIDDILLKRRNSIAHGEDTFVAREDLDSLTDTTISLMRTFSDALENKIQLKTYLSA